MANATRPRPALSLTMRRQLGAMARVAKAQGLPRVARNLERLAAVRRIDERKRGFRLACLHANLTGLALRAALDLHGEEGRVQMARAFAHGGASQ